MGSLNRLAAIFRRKRIERDLDEELQHHIELKTQENIDAGMPPAEARYAALRAFGGVEQKKEQCRDADRLRWLEDLIQDLRYGLRQLRRNPGFTAVAVITLALGIGANTAVFSVVEGVLLRPLPYPHPEGLVAVSVRAPSVSAEDLGLSPSIYFTYREQNQSFQGIGLCAGDSVNVAAFGKPEHLPAMDVTDGLLPVLGVPPILGRWFTRVDDSPGSPDTVILTYGYWRGRFGGKRSVVGGRINVNGKPRTIIGVMPEIFRFPNDPNIALILPVKLDRARTFLGGFGYQAVARLKPGITLAETSADMARMLPIVYRSFPAPPRFSLKMFEDTRLDPDVRPLQQDVVGNSGKVLWVLMASIGLVLLIACANVANLFLARVEGRRRELAIRGALGASPGRIAGELLLESFFLSLIAGVLGLLFASGTLRVLIRLAPGNLPRLDEIGINGPVLMFTLVLAVVTCLFFGLIPSLKYSGLRLGTGLSEAGRSLSTTREGYLARSTLVVTQVALALVLMISSGLMIRTFRVLSRVQPGFTKPGQIQTFRVYIPDAEVSKDEQVVRVQQEILDRLRAIPGVDAAAASLSIPMEGDMSDPLFVRDRTYAPGEVPPFRQFNFVSPGYLATLGVRLVAGRDFTWADIYSKTPVAIVSRNLAREYWRNPAGALGRQIRVSPKDEWRDIVGVVDNIHDNGVSKPTPELAFWPIMTAHFDGGDIWVCRYVTFSVRSPHVGSENFLQDVRQAVRSVDPNLPLFDAHSLDYLYMKSMSRTSFTLAMLAAAGGMAGLIGIIGLYGVVTYSVSHRTRELGIRMALGAQKKDVLQLVVGQGMTLVLTGVGAGSVGALGVTRFLSSQLYGVKPTDPVTFIAVSLLLTVVALLACYIPARRAARVEPMVALRHE